MEDYDKIFEDVVDGYTSLGYSVETDIDDIMYVYYHDEDIDEEHNDGYITIREIDITKDQEILDAWEDVKERKKLIKKQRRIV